MTQENIFKLLAAILIMVLVFLRILPKIRANNIFLKDPSNKSSKIIQAGPMSQPRMNPVTALWVAILIGIMGFAFSIYGSVITNGENGSQQANNNYGIMFTIGLLVSFSVFIHILITEKFASAFYNLKYTLRVWFTTLLLSPLMGVTALLILKAFPNLNSDNLFPLYYSLVVFSSGFGSVMLAILILSINYISKQPLKLSEKRETILLLAECMIAITMLFLSVKIQLRYFWFALWAPYALIMGITIMYYNFDEPPAEIADQNTNAASQI